MVINRDKGQDCALLIAKLGERATSEPGFQYEFLTYSDYIELDDATNYAHAPTDLMVAMWMTPKQMLRAIAGAYAMCWDASHDTNWLKLKYFDFATLGLYKMIELIAQGVQRHEDIVTARWILRTLKQFLGGAHFLNICYIDGDWASRLASRLECPWLKLILDEWHGNQTYGKNMKGRLKDNFHEFLAKLWAFKYDSDIRTQLNVDNILKELIQSCGMYPKKVGNVWIACHSMFEPGAQKAPVKFMTDLVAEVQMWARCYTHHLGVRGEMNGSGYCESYHSKIKNYISVATHVSQFLDVDTTLTNTQDKDRINRRKDAFYNKSSAYITGAHTPVGLLVAANHTPVGMFQGPASKQVMCTACPPNPPNVPATKSIGP